MKPGEVMPTAVTPDQFALNLLSETVTTDRVAAVMARIAGERIEVGPLRFGPGGAVSATGAGLIGRIAVTACDAVGGFGPANASAGIMSFDASIPGDLTIDLMAGSAGRTHRYQGTVVVPLRIAVRLLAPTWVLLDVAPLRSAEVTVQLRTNGLATFVLQTLGDANREVAAQVAAVVNKRVEAVADLRRIDLASLLDHAWDAEIDARLEGSGLGPAGS